MTGFMHSSTQLIVVVIAPTRSEQYETCQNSNMDGGRNTGNSWKLVVAQEKKGSCSQGCDNLSVVRASVDGPAPVHIHVALVDIVN